MNEWLRTEDVLDLLPPDDTVGFKPSALRAKISALNGREDKVYIAGRITGDAEYRLKFDEVASTLRGLHFVVLNPASLPAGMSNADYMRVCLAMIDTADVVVFLPDWQESPGATLERNYCDYIGKRYVAW